MHFTAVEEFAVHEAAFSWHARFPILPFLAMGIHDGLLAGEGLMRGRLAGIPFMNKRGPALTIGAAMRYLAEIPWVPYAMLANDRLHWRQVDDITVEVSTDTLFGRAAVSIEFDAAGDVVRAYSDARPRDGESLAPGVGSTATMRRSAAFAYRGPPRCGGSCRRARSRIGAEKSPRSRSSMKPG